MRKKYIFLILVFGFVICSCNKKPVDARYEFGHIYSEYNKESNDTVFYIAYADTVINDTLHSLYREYRCMEFDSICNALHDAERFRAEHTPDYDVAINDGDFLKADSIDEVLYKAAFDCNKYVCVLLRHVGECATCKQIHNTGYRALGIGTHK